MVWFSCGCFFVVVVLVFPPAPLTLQFSLVLSILHLQPLLAHSERIKLLMHMLFLHWKANPLI